MRTVAVITPPTTFAVSRDEAKSHLRVDGADDDTYIDGLIAAVTAQLDGPGGWLGRAIGTQVLELRLDQFPCADAINLPLPPFASVASIKYDDVDGAEQTYSADSYRVTGGGTDAGLIRLKNGQNWPSIICQAEAIRIRFSAGYGDEAHVPAPIKHAALLMIGHLYANREAAVDASLSELPMGVEALLAPYRIY